MKRYESFTRPLKWFVALLLVAVAAAGCNDGSNAILGGGGIGAPAVTVTSKAITAYSLAGVTGTINEAAKTIAVTMPFGTNVTALVATFTTTGRGVPTVGGVNQISGTTPNDFTLSKAYIVTATDNSTATYTVTVTVASATAKAITAYSINATAGTINETAKTIAVTLPFGTDRAALVATYTTTGTSVKVGTTLQVSGTTANDFTNSIISPVAYIVTAGDNSTVTYTVTVTLASAAAKAITAYSFVGFNSPGTINETATPKTIIVTVPYGTDVTALVAKYTTTGTSVKVGLTTQTSGSTVNNFTSPVTYTVTAADNSTVDYIVTATPGVVLGLATPFGMAATAGITSTTTTTTINGDVVVTATPTCNGVAAPGGVGSAGFGVSGTACGGVPQTPVLTGSVITPSYPDTTSATAIVNDLKAAFLSITPPAGPPAAGSLGGATNLPAGTTLGAATGSAPVVNDNLFFPGVYQSKTSIMITGDLTLDAQGDSNARFVFQSSSTIGTAAGAAGGVVGTFTRILLVNGAKASNVWWQAGTSATLGLYSEFQGNILASETITMETGATSCGRLLAGAFAAGQFTFDGNVVSVPGRPFAPPATYSQICQ